MPPKMLYDAAHIESMQKAEEDRIRQRQLSNGFVGEAIGDVQMNDEEEVKDDGTNIAEVST